jgi:hypothetical protein
MLPQAHSFHHADTAEDKRSARLPMKTESEEL